MYKLAMQQHAESANWYRADHEYIYKTFDDPELFADLLAATSPRAAVRKNYNIAMRIYNRFKSGREINYVGILPNAIPNIGRALAGVPLSGDKVRAFAENLKGNYNAVTIDVWMLRFFKHPTKKATSKQYKKLAARIRRQAKKHGITPAAMQAICWTYARGPNRKQISYSIIANENQKELF